MNWDRPHVEETFLKKKKTKAYYYYDEVDVESQVAEKCLNYHRS